MKMKDEIKVVVCDMDGTLLNSEHTISETNLEAIQRLEDKGIPFVVATGRAYQLMKPYFDMLDLKNPFVLSNGGEVSLPYSETPLQSAYLNKEDAIQIMDYCKKHNMVYLVYTRDAIYSTYNSRVEFFKEQNKKLKPHQQAIFEEMIDHKELTTKHRVNKVLIVEIDRAIHQQAVEDIKNMGEFEIAESQTSFIDVNPFAVSKGNALPFIASYFNIDIKNIMALGDQDNDVSMLQNAGFSICMGNGSEKAKLAADYITKTNDLDGVAHAINTFILK
ncbi:Cof-type HAD-IIB family hydrolase [Candidatus Izimaplasma bacterium]|nr:Cof-type HAD-IIB family hydrolase [Candidatus Izimaplasma bacterium]